MDSEALSKSQFAILHELLIETCFAGQLHDVPRIPDYKLYGYNGANLAKSIKGKLAAIGEINARALRDAVKDYYDTGMDKIELKRDLYQTILAFLDFEDLAQLTAHFFREKGVDPARYRPPTTLTYRKKKGSPLPPTRLDARFESLKETNWWVYTRHHSSDENSLKILRQGFQIRRITSGGDCEIILWNRQPYSTFSGLILRGYSGDNLLDCELVSTRQASKKRMYILFHVNFNQYEEGALFLGMYLTHSDNASVRSGTMVLERISRPIPEEDLVRPAILDQNTEELDENIKKFFSGKHLNQIKLPRSIFHKEDLDGWLKRKQLFRSLPVYDLYIAAPLRGLAEHEHKCAALKADLLDLFRAHAPLAPAAEAALARETAALVDRRLWSASPHAAPLSDLTRLQADIRAMIDDLTAAELGFRRIWYPLRGESFNPDKKVDPGYLLNEQFDEFRRSRSYLFIFPHPLVSSILVQAGWALMAALETRKPIFLVYSGKADLPFLLQKADTLKTHHIFMTSLEEIGGIGGIPAWIRDNRFHELLDG